jgi:hypothetical protein
MKFPGFFLYVFSLIFLMHWISGMSQGPELQRAHMFCCVLFNIYHCVVLKYSEDMRNMQTPVIDDVVPETEGALRSHSYVLFPDRFNFLLHLIPLVFATL